MAKSKTYEEFVEKFKPKKTTDDCYTPAGLYEDIKNYVCERFGVDETTIIRPFYPGGDYEAEDYTGRVVVDNPPFSIMAKIIQFYEKNNIKFFLFTSGLKLSRQQLKHKLLITGASMIAENGADVPVDFVTNLDGENAVETCPALSAILNKHKQAKKVQRKLKYPKNVMRASDFHWLAKQGVYFKVNDFERVINMYGDGEKVRIFGGGILINEETVKRRGQAEKQGRENQQKRKEEREKEENYMILSLEEK